MWEMVEETNKSFNITPTLAIGDDDERKNLKQFSSVTVPVFVHLTLYRAHKWGIWCLLFDSHIKTEMGQGSMGEVVGILIPIMFKSDDQP